MKKVLLHAGRLLPHVFVGVIVVSLCKMDTWGYWAISVTSTAVIVISQACHYHLESDRRES